jgi:Ca-activated chloride channel family protein
MNEWFESRFGFLFADPWMLAILAVVPFFLWWRLARRDPAASTGFGARLATLPKSLRARWVQFPVALQALGIVISILALARPIVRERVPLRNEGIDILLVLDVSSSMLATDMDDRGQMSRVAMVKQTAKKFVEARPTDRIGLLTFCRYADLKCPLTLDHGALVRFVDDTECVQPGSEEDKTAIGLGLARAAQILKTSPAKSRVIVLLTDGQENVLEVTPSDAAKLASDFAIKVYTVGAGTGDRTFLGMREIDFTEIQNIAKVTGGRFFRARDARGLAETYATIDSLEKSKLEDPRYRYEEKYAWLAVPGLAAIALALILRTSLFATIP